MHLSDAFDSLFGLGDITTHKKRVFIAGNAIQWLENHQFRECHFRMFDLSSSGSLSTVWVFFRQIFVGQLFSCSFQFRRLDDFSCSDHIGIT